MATAFIEMIQDTLSDPKQINLKKIKTLVEETVEFFQQLKLKIQSTDPQVREAAMKEAMQVKEALEVQMDMIAQIMKIDPSQFATLAEGDMNGEEKGLVTEIKTKLESLNQQKAGSAPKVKKARKLQFIG